MTQDKINKAVEDLKQLIIDEKEHQKTYGGASRAAVCAYNRSALMIEEFAPDILKSLLQSDYETTYTRKQLQEACANAYQRGVDNRPYIERFDEYLKSDNEGREVLADAHPDSKESEPMEVTFIDSMKDEIYTYFACCPRKDCDNGSIVINSNFCQKCGQKLIWPDNQKKESNK